MLEMRATIKFDREIDVKKHNISPGGYEVVLNNGKTVAFDFVGYVAHVDENDKTLLHCMMHELDVDAFPEAKILETYGGYIDSFEEFYVYTGEDGDAEIEPWILVSGFLHNGDNIIPFGHRALGRIWDKIEGEGCAVDTEEQSEKPRTDAVDTHKIIDDAMEKGDRSVYILMHKDGMSVTISPYVEDRPKWLHMGNGHFKCSDCGHEHCDYYGELPVYCGHCGEKMYGIKDMLEDENP